MSDSKQEQRREFYRLVYPEAARPEIRIDGRVASLHELAEVGIRFSAIDQYLPGRRLAGSVTFRDAEIEHFSGEVLRQEGEEIILLLHKGFTLKRIIAEQQLLLREYPAHFDRPSSNEISENS